MRRREPSEESFRADPAPAPPRRRSAALLPMSLLVACMGAQNAIAATLLPTVFAGLDATARFSANYAFFFAANLVGVVIGGVLGQRQPPGRVLVWGVLVLVTGGALVASAGSVWPILCGRAAQGLGGGIAIVVVYVAIGSGFAAHQRPGALAAVSTGWVVATVVGPSLAAGLAETTSWRAAYVVLTVVVAGAGLLTCVRLRDVRPPATAGSARAVLLVLAPALAVLAIGLELGSGVTSVAVLAVLAVVVVTTLRPLLPAGTYRLRTGVAAADRAPRRPDGGVRRDRALASLRPRRGARRRHRHGGGAGSAWARPGGRRGRSPTPGACARASPERAASAPPAPARGCWRPAPWASASCSLRWCPLVVPLVLWVVAAYGLGLALVPMGTSLYEESPVERYPMNAAALQLADVSVAAVIIGFGSTLSAVADPAHRVDVVAASFVLAAACRGPGGRRVAADQLAGGLTGDAMRRRAPGPSCRP